MKLPNFLIIGAQRCGTTALYHALRQHPDIYMSPIKEPFYFVLNDAPPPYQLLTPKYAQMLCYTKESYVALFQGAVGHRSIGEASAIYLSSYQPARTAANIYAFNPNMRLIALLRQPADRAYSAFQYYHAKDWEPKQDFAAALAAEPARLGGDSLPDLRHYLNGCYFANLKPYFDRFPREQIRVYLYEDWDKQPQVMLRDLFAFLEVDKRVAIQPKRINPTLTHRHRWLHRFLDQPNATRQLLEKVVRGRLRAHLYRKLRVFNRCKPPTLPLGVRRELTERYRNDIVNLQTLIGRDLSHWLKA